MTGCTSATVKSRNEVWLIDYDDLVLYRVISDQREQAIPIFGNPVMKDFVCVSSREFDELVKEIVNK